MPPGALDGSFPAQGMWLESLQTEPAFDFLHKDPRYRALVKEIGLPPTC